jgi:hypothetical protein
MQNRPAPVRTHVRQAAAVAKKPVAAKRPAARQQTQHDDTVESQVEQELDLLGVGAGNNGHKGFEEF